MIPLRDTAPCRRTPIVTWVLLASNVAVFLFELTLGPDSLQRFLEDFGLITARFTDPLWAASSAFPTAPAISTLTSMFLHLNWAHLLANLWTLWIFGDNVEDRMGHARFLLFYILMGLLAGVVHCLVHPHSTIPAIGASGSVAGVLGAYLVLYPRARIVVAVPLFLFFFFARLAAVCYLILWIATQVMSGTLASLGVEPVDKIAWWAHTGAFLAGIAMCQSFLLPAPPPVLHPRRAVHMRKGGIAPALTRSSTKSASV
jgi:membrane associated rhomboid family serine protease